MNIYFSILTVALIILIITALKYGEQKKSLSVFYLMIFTVFYGPSFYYVVLNGTAYSRFTLEDLNIFMIIGTCSYLYYSMMIVIKNKSKNIRIPTIKRKKSKQLILLYMGFIFLLITAYIGIYYRSFPLIHSLTTGMKIMRPDTTGSIPYYFTFSVFMHFIIPSFFFYIIEAYVIKRRTQIVMLLLVSFIMVVGGNKGILVYFFIFYWIYIWKMKFDIKILAMALVSIILYKVLGGGLSTVSEGFDIVGELSAPFRRFFVTQGSMLINRISMVRFGYEFSSDTTISTQVSQYVYGVEVGAAPTYFIGDYIVKYGLIIGYLIHALIIFLIYSSSKRVDKTSSIFVKWSFYSVIYIIAMSGLGQSFMYRALAIAINFGIVTFLNSDIMKKSKIVVMKKV